MVEEYRRFSLIDESRGAGEGGQEGHRDRVDTAEVALMKEFIEWEQVKGPSMCINL